MNSRGGRILGGIAGKSMTWGAGIASAALASVYANGNIDTIAGAVTGGAAAGRGLGTALTNKVGSSVRYRLDKKDQRKNAPIIQKMEAARLKNNLGNLSQAYQTAKASPKWRHDENDPKTAWTDSEIEKRSNTLLNVDLNSWEAQDLRIKDGPEKGQLNEEGKFAQQLQEVSRQLQETTGDGSVKNVLKHMRENEGK